VSKSVSMQRSHEANGNGNRLCQRVADAASLAGRLAHDFDNLLMGILGFAELAQSETPAGTPAREYVAELYKVARRGVVITQQMHDLSRVGRNAGVPTPIPEVWQTTSAMVLNAAASKPNVTVEFDEDLPQVALSAEELGLALRHILANAVESQRDGGEVRVTARSVTLADRADDFLPRPVEGGKYVEVTVTDNGPGIKPEVFAQITSSPLVTTKPDHRGLGIAIVYRVLDTTGGGVRFESACPTGTRVTLMLPVATVRRSAPKHPSGRTAATLAQR
jgi:two-component system cell cycle sensor histidine kinase/response regulator CckA